MTYCSVAEVKTYLGVTTSTDDSLLASLVMSAQARIDDYTRRKFEAAGDTSRTFDITDTDGQRLVLMGDISYITSVTNAGSAIASTEWFTYPRFATPYSEIILDDDTSSSWSSDQNDIIVTGRWAYMERIAVTAIARSTNTVTATVADSTGVFVGQKVYCAGVADTTFNGGFTVTAVTDTTIAWAQTASNDTDTTGTILFTPPGIRHACIRLTAWMYRQKDTQQGDIDRPLLTGDGVTIMPTTLPADVVTILRQFVKRT